MRLLFSLLSSSLLLFTTACDPASEAGQSSRTSSGGGGGGGGGERRGPPPAQVIAATVELKDIPETIELVGSLAANERITVTSEISGKIQQIHFHEGAEVQQGDILLTLNPAKLKAQVEEARARVTLAENNLKRSRRLVDDRVIPEQDYDQRVSEYDTAQAELSLRKEQLEETIFTAPFEGFLGTRLVSPGQFISAGTPVASLVDVTPIKAEFQVPERHFAALRPGQQVGITVAAYPQRVFTGEVFFISPQIDTTTRTVLVKAELPNEDYALKPGMFGALRLTLETRKQAMTIPEAAIFFRNGQQFVYTIGPEMQSQLKPVEVGLRMPGEAEIVRGLEPGDQVVVEGYQKIFFPGMPVSLTPESSGEETPEAAGQDPA